MIQHIFSTTTPLQSESEQSNELVKHIRHLNTARKKVGLAKLLEQEISEQQQPSRYEKQNIHNSTKLPDSDSPLSCLTPYRSDRARYVQPRGLGSKQQTLEWSFARLHIPCSHMQEQLFLSFTTMTRTSAQYTDH